MTSLYSQARAIVSALSFVFLVAGSISCGSDPAAPSSPASQAAVTGTSSQAAAAGTAVATPPAVRVVDANGQPVQGVTVVFTISSGGGTVAGGSPTTNSNGIATVTSWTLGATAGTNTLTATIGTLARVTFTATGVAGPPAQLTKSSTDPQTAITGSTVASPPSVTVRDAGGNPVAAVSVAFSIGSGGGSVVGNSPVSNNNGIATVTSWTLGANVGTNTLTATIGTLAPVTFTTTGIAGVPSQIAKTSLDPQTAVVGTAVAAALSVTVRDAGGNPVPGVAVTFKVMGNNGSIVGSAASSNTSGVATSGTWMLSTEAGLNAVTATVTGLPPVTFTATGTPAAPIRLDISPATAGLLPGGTQQITLVAVDQYRNMSPATGTFVSASPAIATVSAAGLTTGVRVGSTTVAVASGALSGSVAVTVSNAVLGVDGRPWAVRVSSANKLAVTQRELNSITFVDATGTGARVTAALAEEPADVAFTRSGSIAFVGLFDGIIRRVNVADGTVTGTVRPYYSAYRLALSPDETRLYVSTAFRLFAVNPTTMSVIGAASISGYLVGLALSADGQFLYVTQRGVVSRVVAQTLVTDAFNDFVGGSPEDVAVTADGNEVVVANGDGWVDILDGVTLNSRQRIPIANTSPFGLALSPDDAHIWVTSPTTGQVFVINRATRAIVRTINVGGMPRRIAFTTDGRAALVSNEAGWVDIIR